ncbi:TetR/AcrR family transcriptional regulator [Mycobacterium sp. BMJ-28]
MTESPARRTQEERRGEAERRLITAAAELVAEIGPARVTLALVGERAGYSRGLATHHFGSKSALMERVVDEVGRQFRAALRAQHQSGDPVAELRGFIGYFLDVVADMRPINRARLALWAQAATNQSDEFRPAMRAVDREFRDGIEARLRAAAVTEPGSLATLIVAMLRGVALQSLLDAEVDLAAARSEIERLLAPRLRP